ncbi:hypothetical protein [Salinactinospora qingdaonensis]|uniref:Endonuclease/Exonuclease/phosphatase family protein n=1 Tax=Salinactinospora qingdaonensis TaxID=702744 RepID=A0ABP7G7X8_9ACTN
MKLPVALINLDNGWSHHNFDFTHLPTLFTHMAEPPALILVNEATRWWDHGGHGKYSAARALSQRYKVPYTAEVGWLERSDHPPALIYDPTRLHLTWWGNARSTPTLARRNTAHLLLADSDKHPTDPPDLRVVLQHWHPWDGDTRLHQARAISWTADPRVPTLLGGDLNSTASGPHLPDKTWQHVPAHQRHHKGHQPAGPTTAWHADTRALDHLIGTWNPQEGKRTHGAGFHALAELAHTHGTPAEEAFRPTTNTPPEHGGAMLIDWLLVNHPLHHTLTPGTYHVHTPPTDHPPLTDHRLITATLQL